MKALWLVALLGLGTAQAATVSVTLAPEHAREPLNGRLLLLLSVDPGKEPRFQIEEGTKSQQVFGIDAKEWQGSAAQVFDSKALGYPRLSLADVPAGTYRVQVLLHRYETFRRKDGHVVQLPMDRGEGQVWNKAPGNLYSAVREIKLDPADADADRTGARQEHRADQAARRYGMGEARAYPEPVAHGVLGPPDASGRARAAAEGLGPASEGALSADDQSRSFPRGLRWLPPRASGSEARPGLQRALPSLGLQPIAAGARAPVLQGLDRATDFRACSRSRFNTRIRTTTTRTR